MKKENKETLMEKLNKGNIIFCGYRGKWLPNFLLDKKEGKAQLFLRKGSEVSLNKPRVEIKCYENLTEIKSQNVDICFLDGEAVRVLLARFPKNPRYIFIRLYPSLDWLISFPGLFWRLKKRKIKIKGVLKLKAGREKYKWLVLSQAICAVEEKRSGLSSEVGIQGLFDFLRKEKIKYVVLRHFEKLPNLHRKGGDVDIMTDNEDEDKVRSFLKKNPGDIPISIKTPRSMQRSKVTYYPPPLARKILESAVDGPAGSRVPAPKEYFLSFAYHALYHKGFASGVPSRLFPDDVEKASENDYTKKLKKAAKDIRLEVDITMEDLDNYLQKEGWRPKIDTLEKIAKGNGWVWKYFFARKESEEIGLGFFVLKRKVLKENLINPILEIIESDRFTIVYKKVIPEDKVSYVAGHLRGGDWRAPAGEKEDDFLPAMVVVVLDFNIMQLSRNKKNKNNLQPRIRSLKTKLRKEYGNIVHSTDNTLQSWEYIKICFPEESPEIRQKIKSIKNQKEKLSSLKRIKSFFYFLPYRVKAETLNILFKKIIK